MEVNYEVDVLLRSPLDDLIYAIEVLVIDYTRLRFKHGPGHSQSDDVPPHEPYLREIVTSIRVRVLIVLSFTIVHTADGRVEPHVDVIRRALSLV